MAGIPSILLVSLGASAVAVTGFLIIHQLGNPINVEKHQSFLDAMLGIVGTLVSILLGLLVAAALDRYQSLEDSVDAEAANLSEVYRLTAGLPKDTQQKIRRDCANYCLLVLNDEWPRLARKELSQKTFIGYVELLADVVQFKPSDNGETNLHSSMLSAMKEIGDSRRHRVLAMNNTAWSGHLMPMLLLCSGIVLIFAYLYVRKGELLHGLIICLVAAALGGNLGLVFLLSNPFSGDWIIQPRGFQLNLQILEQAQRVPQLKKLYTIEPKK